MIGEGIATSNLLPSLALPPQAGEGKTDGSPSPSGSGGRGERRCSSGYSPGALAFTLKDKSSNIMQRLERRAIGKCCKISKPTIDQLVGFFTRPCHP